VGNGVNGVATQYLQDVAAPLPIVVAETTAGQTNYYVYGNDLLTQLDPANTTAFYHPDGLGSTRALSDAAGARTDWYSYDVFGATRSHAGPSGQSFTFTGEQVDGESGLVFLRARCYEPVVGRFISKDSFAGYVEKSMSLNRYVYAHNRPTLLVDPSGFDAIGDARGFLDEVWYQTKAVPEFVATGAWKIMLQPGFYDREFFKRASMGMDGAVNFIRTPSRYLEEQAQESSGLTRLSFEAGALVWDILPPISIPSAFYSSLSADIKYANGDMSTAEFSATQVESMMSLFLDHLGNMTKQVPGRKPHFGTRAFFLGAHTRHDALELLYGMVAEYAGRQAGDLVRILWGSQPK
jgi:RHS repeat-associated protein